jgi:hypothetical protein
MRKHSLLVTALLVLGSTTFAQTLSPADRDRAVQYLEQTRDGVIAATKGLSDAQWKFKAAPDRWSAAETLEHIAVSEEFLLANVKKDVMKAPAGAADRDTAKTDALVLAAVPDRSRKAQAPPELVPKGRWTPAEALDHFLKSRAETIAFLQSTPDLREHVSDSPIGQKLDAYEWLLFIGAHSERHTKQIAEVKSNPNFPKNK